MQISSGTRRICRRANRDGNPEIQKRNISGETGKAVKAPRNNIAWMSQERLAGGHLYIVHNIFWEIVGEGEHYIARAYARLEPKICSARSSMGSLWYG